MNFKEQEIKSFALDRIKEIKEYDQERYDQLVRDNELHNEIFNTDYYIIGTFEAKKWLSDQVFDIIEYIKEYEEDNFGEVTTDLSNPEKLVNMYVYILGEKILYEVLK
jgi:hypothetical protein|tara:strand:- start:559 stop:882 length:324 start_codon:yes stop_codon:yes gene_type:complete